MRLTERYVCGTLQHLHRLAHVGALLQRVWLGALGQESNLRLRQRRGEHRELVDHPGDVALALVVRADRRHRPVGLEP